MTILEIVAVAKQTGTLTQDHQVHLEKLMWSSHCTELDKALLSVLVRGLESGFIRAEPADVP